MVEFTIIRSDRKTLAIHIKPDGSVEIRAPLRLAKTEIERFIKQKSHWIEQKLAVISARRQAGQRELPPPHYQPGELEQVTIDFVKAWERRLGVTVSYVGFRAMTSRWGSCTPKTGRIRLNIGLAYCPKECLEYVIVHELAHIRENNHSPHFWKLIADVMPDYQMRQTQLKELCWLLEYIKKGDNN